MVTRKFDPFAPVWLFLVGYLQVYVIQAISYHDWATRCTRQGPGRRGQLAGASGLSLWFLSVYHFGLATRPPGFCPSAPALVAALVAVLSPPLILWGLFCSNMLVSGSAPTAESSTGEESCSARSRS